MLPRSSVAPRSIPTLLLTLLRRHAAATPSSSHSLSTLHSYSSRDHQRLHLNPHFSIRRVRSSLRRSRTKNDLLPLNHLITVYGLLSDEPLAGEFITQCFILGEPELALSTFSAFVSTPSVYLHNLVIKGLYKSGLHEQVLSLYRICNFAGRPSDCYTFPFAIKACAALRCLRLGGEVHGVVLRTGYGSNVVVQTALLGFYGRTGLVDTARKLFDTISQPDIVSWNVLIASFTLNGRVLEALFSLQQIWVKDLKPGVRTLASIVPICSRTGYFDLGRSLHGYAIKSGFDLDQVLIPAFISMYDSNGNASSARFLTDSSPLENEVVWNSMIRSYKETMQPNESYKAFKRMLSEEVHPNSVSFASVIPCCVDMGSILSGECIHASVIKYGLEEHLHVVTSLISMYAKLGKMDSAKYLFATVDDKNLLTCNTMISGYLYNKLWYEALSVVYDMQSAGFAPDVISLIGVLSACSKLENLHVGQSAHAFIIRRGLDTQLNLSNALLAFYSSCNHLHMTSTIFQAMKRRDSISWNTLISGCVDIQGTENTVALVRQMQQEGVKIDLVTLISALPCFKEAGDLKHGMSAHAYAIKSGSVLDVSLSNALTAMYSSCSDLRSALLLFDLMPQKDVITWNSLITGYKNWNLQDEALSLLHRMIESGEKPNYVTLLHLLPSCSSLLHGKSIHGYALRARMISQTPLVTSLVIMYARFEDRKSCFALFEGGDRSKITLWNSMFSILVQVGDVKEAMSLFHKLLEAELVPDNVTILSLVSICIQTQNIRLSESVLSYVTKNGFIKDIAVSNALIDLYAKCGSIAISREIFDQKPDKDSVTWSVMINGYALHGDGKRAFDLFLEMKNCGVRAEGVTYLSVLSACSHCGLVENSIMAFKWMLEDGITPTMEHFGCVMDLLGRRGRLSEAYLLLKKLPYGAPTSMLESLLGACAFHGNVEIGEKVGEEIAEREPKNSGAYVILHNLYAGTGRWEDASRVRELMDNREVRKSPGFTRS